MYGVFSRSHSVSSSFRHSALSPFRIALELALLLGVAALPGKGFAQTSFGSVSVGSSASATVTLTIPSGVTLTGVAVVTQGNPNLDFTNAGGGTCTTGSALAASSCTVNVSFAPQQAGARYGAVVLADSDGVIATAYLVGTGQAPQATFLPGAVTTVASRLGTLLGDYIAADSSGNVYVLDYDNHTLYKQTRTTSGYTQTTIDSSFTYPSGVAVDGQGNVYVTDQRSGVLFEETLNNGQYTKYQIASGFSIPYGVAVDGSGNVYVEDAGDKVVYKLRVNGTRSSFGSGLVNPQTIAVDGSGNVYLTDEGNGNLYKETPFADRYNQTTIGSGYFSVAVDGNGGLYASGFNSNFEMLVNKLTPSNGQYTQTAIGREFGFVVSLAVDGAGNAYASDRGATVNGAVYPIAVYRVDVADPPSLSFADTAMGATSSDSPQTVTVANLGNESLAFSGVTYPANFSEASGVATDCTGSTSLAAAGTCTLSIDFTPTATESGQGSFRLNGDLTITTNTLNVTSTQQQVALNGNEVVPFTTVVTLATNLNPDKLGTPFKLTATVAAASGNSSVAPSGSVTFLLGIQKTLLGVVPLNGATAVLQIDTLPAGSNVITAMYAGDMYYQAATSAALTETILKGTAKVSLVSSASTGHVDGLIKLTATVTGGDGAFAPSGSVAFSVGKTSLGVVALAKGVAVLSTTALAPGRDSVEATYSGDANYNTASATVSETIEKPIPAMHLASSKNPAKVDIAVTFKAAIEGGAGVATGTVTFKDGAITLGTEPLKDGVASLTTSKLAVGRHEIVAKYDGNADYGTAQSAVVVEVIDKLAAAVTLLSSADPAKAGSKVTFTAVVAHSGPEPTGTIVFKSGSTTLGAVTLSRGKASFSTKTLAEGTHSITASYSGSAVYLAATSNAVKEKIEP